MPLQSNWDHINVPLPDLMYHCGFILVQEKESTGWAAHSHTPSKVKYWSEFDSLVVTEGQKSCNSEPVQDIGFRGKLMRTRLSQMVT